MPPQPEQVEPTYNTIVIRIEYTLEDPRNGVVYVQKDDEIAPYRSNHVYTVNQPLPGATRSWLPCIDRISERCTWDMEFIVPRKDDGAAVPEYDGEGSFDEVNGIMVVCSGDIIEQVIHPTDNSKKIVHYNLSVPTPAPFIGFAIGPFEMIKLSPSQLQEEVMTAADLDENQQQSLMAEINMMSNIYAFALPGLEEELSVSCSFLMHVSVGATVGTRKEGLTLVFTLRRCISTHKSMGPIRSQITSWSLWKTHGQTRRRVLLWLSAAHDCCIQSRSLTRYTAPDAS